MRRRFRRWLKRLIVELFVEDWCENGQTRGCVLNGSGESTPQGGEHGIVFTVQANDSQIIKVIDKLSEV